MTDKLYHLFYLGTASMIWSFVLLTAGDTLCSREAVPVWGKTYKCYHTILIRPSWSFYISAVVVKTPSFSPGATLKVWNYGKPAGKRSIYFDPKLQPPCGIKYSPPVLTSVVVTGVKPLASVSWWCFLYSPCSSSYKYGFCVVCCLLTLCLIVSFQSWSGTTWDFSQNLSFKNWGFFFQML